MRVDLVVPVDQAAYTFRRGSYGLALQSRTKVASPSSEIVAMNFVELLLKQFGGEALGGLASLLGGSPGDLQKALAAAIPTILAGLGGMASNAANGEKLVNTLKDVSANEIDLDSILKGGTGKIDEVSQRGTSILESLLGKGGLVALLAGLAKFLGGSGLIKKLLPLLAPLVLSMITKQLKSSGGGIDIGSLSKLILGQKANIAGAMPAGLGDVLSGIQGLGDFGGLVKDAADSAGRAAASAGRAATAAVEQAASPIAKLLPIALAALVLLGLLWWLFGRTPENAVDAGKAIGNAAQSVGDVSKRALEGAGQAAVDAARKASDAADEAGDVLGAAGKELMGGMKDWFGGMTETIGGITDLDTATAAESKLEEMGSRLETMLESAKKLPEAAQPAVVEFVKGAYAALKKKLDAVLELAGVADVIKPIVDKMVATLDGYLGG